MGTNLFYRIAVLFQGIDVPNHCITVNDQSVIFLQQIEISEIVMGWAASECSYSTL